MPIKSDPLPTFLAACSRRKWEYSIHDCTMPLADWILLVRGVDPAADLRGTYTDARSCVRMLRREGGQRAMFDRRLAAVGIQRTATPARGDIGTVKAPAERRGRVVVREIGAIFLDPSRTAIFTPDAGMLIVSGLPVTAAWRV